MAGINVAVTGANGFIATHIVKDLLARGYNVRGTVRNPDDVTKLRYLLDLPGAKERLTLHKANLLDEGSFDSVVSGVDGVFHTASPFFLTSTGDPQVQYLDPAVKGTLNLLRAVDRAKSVKRVVLTSSVASVVYNEKPRTSTTVVDESWWTDAKLARERGAWYPLSKTLAEQAGWDFVKDKHFDLVVINPGYVIGTILQPTINASSEVIRDYLSGAIKQYQNGVIAFVDVHDVSLAHILAFEYPDAEGRYLLVDRVVHYREVAETLHKLYPEYPVPTEPAYELSEEIAPYIPDKRKTEKLGVDFRPFESQLKDTVASLKEKGWITA